MKNLRIIIPAGVCAIIGIVAVVMLTKGSGEKVLSKSFVGKTGNTTATLHDKDDAVNVGLIKPPQKEDIPPPEPSVDTRYDAEGYVKHSLKYGSAAWNQFSSDLAKEGKYDIFRVVPEDKGYNVLPEQHRPFPWREPPPRYKVLPKGTRMREAEGWDTFRQIIGHQGTHKMTDGSGRKVADYPYSSSVSWGGVPQKIPLITQNTTKEELKHLLSGKEPTAEIITKAENFALGRMRKGLSPFYAGPGSEKLTPIRMYNP